MMTCPLCGYGSDEKWFHQCPANNGVTVELVDAEEMIEEKAKVRADEIEEEIYDQFTVEKKELRQQIEDLEDENSGLLMRLEDWEAEYQTCFQTCMFF